MHSKHGLTQGGGVYTVQYCTTPQNIEGVGFKLFFIVQAFKKINSALFLTAPLISEEKYW